MSAISQKSITGITSITTPAGVDNIFTVHTNDTTERFRVDSNGNQRIAGILTVAQNLNVNGTSKLSGDVTINRTTGLSDAKLSLTKDADQIGIGVQLNQLSGITTSLTTFNSAGQHIFDLAHDTDSTPDLLFKLKHSDTGAPVERLRITSAGYVGINQNSPDYELDVTGRIGFTQQIRGASGSQGTPAYAFDGDHDTGMFRNGVNNLCFGTAGIQRLTIDENGKIGMGVNATNPSFQLQIHESDNTAYAANATVAQLAVGNVNSSSATNAAGIQLFTDGNGRGLVNLSALNNSTSSSADFVIQTRHSATIAERLRITSNGNVVIGNSSPVAGKLEINVGDVSNSATEYHGEDFAINIRANRGESPNEEGNGICFSQRYATSDGGIVRTGAIVGYKIQGDGAFGGGLKFKTQQAGASAFLDIMRMRSDMIEIPHDNVRLHFGVDGDFRIRHTGSENQIYSNSTHPIVFSNSGGERLRITNIGRLMTQSAGFIYTASSAGSLTLAGGNTNLGGKIVLSGGNSPSTGDIGFYAEMSQSSPTERLRIKANGEVTIATSNPTTFRYVGTGHPYNNNNYTLHGFSNIGLVGQYSTLNMPMDHSAATTAGNWWMLGRSSGNTNEWGLSTRPGNSNNLRKIWRCVTRSQNDGILDYQTFHSFTGTETLRIDSSSRALINNRGNAMPGLSANADDLVIGYGTESNETGISMYSTTASGIRFNDNSGTDGAIEYAHSARELRFNAANGIRLAFSVNAANSPVFNMGVSSGDYNNHNKGDRTSVKVGDYLNIESARGAGHNTRAGLGYNCYFDSLEDFYCGTNSPSGGDNRPAAYGMAYGNHYFYSDASNTAHSSQAQLTMTRNMVIDRQGYVTTPNQCGFHMIHDGNQSLSSGDMITNWDTDASSSRSYIKNCTFNSGRFVAPVAGLYFFTAQLLLSSVATNDDSIHILWTKGSSNGTFTYWNTRHDGSAAHGSYGYGTYLPVTGSTTVYLTANEIFGIKASFSGSISVYGPDQNWGHWSGYLVG